MHITDDIADTLAFVQGLLEVLQHVEAELLRSGLSSSRSTCPMLRPGVVLTFQDACRRALSDPAFPAHLRPVVAALNPNMVADVKVALTQTGRTH